MPLQLHTLSGRLASFILLYGDKKNVVGQLTQMQEQFREEQTAYFREKVVEKEIICTSSSDMIRFEDDLSVSANGSVPYYLPKPRVDFKIFPIKNGEAFNAYNNLRIENKKIDKSGVDFAKF